MNPTGQGVLVVCTASTETGTKKERANQDVGNWKRFREAIGPQVQYTRFFAPYAETATPKKLRDAVAVLRLSIDKAVLPHPAPTYLLSSYQHHTLGLKACANRVDEIRREKEALGVLKRHPEKIKLVEVTKQDGTKVQRREYTPRRIEKRLAYLTKLVFYFSFVVCFEVFVIVVLSVFFCFSIKSCFVCFQKKGDRYEK
jgi:hypothetical protein